MIEAIPYGNINTFTIATYSNKAPVVFQWVALDTYGLRFYVPKQMWWIGGYSTCPLEYKITIYALFFASNQIPSPIGIRRLGLTETPFPSIASPNRYGWLVDKHVNHLYLISLAVFNHKCAHPHYIPIQAKLPCLISKRYTSTGSFNWAHCMACRGHPLDPLFHLLFPPADW